jgi:hypothetical protein
MYCRFFERATQTLEKEVIKKTTRAKNMVLGQCTPLRRCYIAHCISPVEHISVFQDCCQSLSVCKLCSGQAKLKEPI